MSEKNLPIKKGDNAIKYGDSGPSVKIIQDFLQKLPYIQKEQDFLGSFGADKTYSLLDGNIYGKFESKTHQALLDYQRNNYQRIIKNSNLSEQEWEKEKGTVGFATWSIMAKDGGASLPIPKSEPNTVNSTENTTKEENYVPLTLGKNNRSLIEPKNSDDNPQATHFVKTKDSNSRLALRVEPAYVKVGKNAWEDTDEKGDLIIMMPNDTMLKVIEPGVGYNCEWHQVEVVDDNEIFNDAKNIQNQTNVYAYAEFIAPLAKTPPMLSINCRDCAQKGKIYVEPGTFPLWYSFTDCEPFFDEATCSYYIVITTRYERTNEDLIIQQKKEALYEGVTKLLNFYNKQRGPAYVDRLLSSFKFAEIPDDDGYILDERPGALLKFLVKIPAKYFDAIPNDNMDLMDIPNLYSEENPEGWRTTIFYSNELKKNIEIVAKRLEEYSTDIEKWEGEVNDFDVKMEAKKLRSFLPRFREFVEINNYKFEEDKEVAFEIGFEGPCYNITYVLINQESSFVPLKIGFDCFLQSDPINHMRTMGYIFYLTEMVDDIKRRRKNWIEFFQEYTCPQPEIRVSKSPKKKKNIYGFDGDTFKDEEQKKSEDEYIGDQIKDLLEQRKNFYEYIGDNLLYCENIKKMLSEVSSIEEAYYKVLNKIDIKEIATYISSCIVSKFLPIDLIEVICDQIFKIMSSKELRMIIELLPYIDTIAIREYMSIRKKIYERAEDLREAIENVISKEKLIEAIRKLQPERVRILLDKLMRLDINFQFRRILFRPPVIRISDFFPTVDIMSTIIDEIVSLARELLSKTLLTLIKQIFEQLCNVCSMNTSGGQKKYGDNNIKDILKNNNDMGDIERDIKNDLGIPLGDFGDLLDDLSNILLPEEVCSLLEDSASDDLIKLVKNFINTRYSNLSSYFHDSSKIQTLFSYLGTYVDPEICRKINERSKIVLDNICFSPNNIRKNLLQGRLSDQQLNKMMTEEKKKNVEKLSKMIGVTNDNILPDILRDGNFNKLIGNMVIKNEHPSVQVLNERVINSIFDSVGISFDTDIRGFVNSFVNYTYKKEYDGINKEEAYKSRKAFAKSLNEPENMSKDDSDILLKDPDLTSAGRGSKTIAIVPEVRNNLSNGKNFIKKSSHDNNVNYYLKVSVESVEKKIERFKNTLSKKIDETKVRDVIYNIETLQVKNLKFEEPDFSLLMKQARDIVKDNEVCPEDSIDFNKTVFDILTILSSVKPLPNDVILNYIVPDVGERNKFEDRCVVTVGGMNEKDLKIIVDKEIPESKMKLINEISYDIDRYLTSQQNIFLSYIRDSFKKVVDFTNKEQFYNEQFKEYISNDLFNNINIEMIRGFSNLCAKSKFFNIDQLKTIENFFTKKMNSVENNCMPDMTKVNNNGIFDIAKIKQFVKDSHDKLVQNMDVSKNTNIGDFEQMQEAGRRGITQSIVQLFVLDYMLRGMFVFSQFNVLEIIKDEIFVKYVLEKLKGKLKSTGIDFVNEIFLTSKNIVLDRKGKIVDPLAEDVEGKTDIRLQNEVHPDYQSGEVFFELLCKESIKDIADDIENLFGTVYKNVNSLFYNFKELFPISDVLMSTTDIEKFMKDRKDGSFIIEKYARICEGEKILTEFERKKVQDEVIRFSDVYKNSKFVYGLRLKLLFKNNSSYFANEKFSSVNGNFDKSFVMIEDENEYLMRRTTFPDTAKSKYISFSIPLIEIEEEELRDRSVFGKPLGDIFDVLKDQMINSEKFKLLFEHVFSFQRIISLLSIYSAESLSTIIPDIESNFELTSNSLVGLMEVLRGEQDWWNKKEKGVDDLGGNVGINKIHMDNLTSQGSTPSLKKIALMAVPILFKGVAGMVDPSYKLIKTSGLPLNFGSIPAVAPINIFGPFGFGPPITPWGLTALGFGLLPGEENNKKKEQLDKSKSVDDDKCEEDK